MKKILAIGIVALLVVGGIGLAMGSASDNKETKFPPAVPFGGISVTENMVDIVEVEDTPISEINLDEATEQIEPIHPEDVHAGEGLVHAYFNSVIKMTSASDNKETKFPPAVPFGGISVTENMVDVVEVEDTPISEINLDETTEQIEPADVHAHAALKLNGVSDAANATYRIPETVLKTNECDNWGDTAGSPFYLNPDETVEISISWIPSSSTVKMGIYNPNTGVFRYVTGTGGACSHTFTIREGGNYYIRICNNGPYTIRYQGYFTV